MQKGNERWVLAQNYEYNWWKNKASGIDYKFYQDSANEICSFYNKYGVLGNESYILEIGTGACGILTFLHESKYRFGIDPLEDFYSTIPAFTALRDDVTQYMQAKGESIPYSDSMFDLIIVDNVLDHCEDPNKVMQEVVRVLKPEGKIYFRQNTYNLYGKLIRNIMEVFLIDKGHPFTFRKKDIQNIFKMSGLTTLHAGHNGYMRTWINEIKSKSIKDKVKALLFVTRDKTIYFLSKTK